MSNKSSFSLAVYLGHHRHALAHAWHQFRRAPFTTILTIAVLSIALLLPTSLLVILNNAQHVTQRWDTGANVALYLKPGVTNDEALALTQTLQKQGDIAQATYISPQQGMAEFVAISGLSDAFTALNANPLPAVIEVKPASTDPTVLQNLQTQLQAMPQVLTAKLDMQWVKRLFAIVELSKKFVYGILAILALAVLLIIGNTIRAAVQAYQTEIRVLKLVGASKAFIRRPFLYSGVLYGFMAGIIAAILVSLFIAWLAGPAEKLAMFYGSAFRLLGLSANGILILLIFGIVLGFLGSWLALGRHLLDFEID